MRRVLILGLALAALPAAPAAAWQEVPFRTLPGHGVATCLRATGPEGGLATLGPVGARSAAADLLAAGTQRPAVSARVRFPVMFECPAVREQGGAGVVAAPALRRATRSVQMYAAVRVPGGAFRAPVPLGSAPLGNDAHDVAVSARGDAIVAWVQRKGDGSSERIVVARHGAGAPFGPVQALTPWGRHAAAFVRVPLAAALDPQGRATVAWGRRANARDDRFSVEAASASAGGAFGPVQVLTSRARSVERLSLAAAAGGAALLAHDGDEMELFERSAGAGRFGAARRLGAPGSDGLPNQVRGPALALRDDGGAVVAWREGERHPGARALTRLPGGAFTERVVAPGGRDTGFSRCGSRAMWRSRCPGCSTCAQSAAGDRSS